MEAEYTLLNENDLHLSDESLDVINNSLLVCIANLKSMGFLKGSNHHENFTEEILNLGKEMSNLIINYINDIRVHQVDEWYGPDEISDELMDTQDGDFIYYSEPLDNPGE